MFLSLLVDAASHEQYVLDWFCAPITMEEAMGVCWDRSCKTSDARTIHLQVGVSAYGRDRQDTCIHPRHQRTAAVHLRTGMAYASNHGVSMAIDVWPGRKGLLLGWQDMGRASANGKNVACETST